MKTYEFEEQLPESLGKSLIMKQELENKIENNEVWKRLDETQHAGGGIL